MNDSIIHAFHSCNWSQFFFLEVIKWFNKENVTSFSLSPTELIFGVKVDNSSTESKSNIIRKLNFTFLYAKYYLHNQYMALSVNELIVILSINIFRKILCIPVVMMLIGM